MWIAETLNTAGNTSQQTFLRGPLCKVGRHIDCCLSFPSDKSISRNHAEITITDSKLTVCDLGSKFGTYEEDNAQKLAANSPIEIRDGQIIRFGAVSSKVRFVKVRLSFCLTRLEKKEKETVKKAAELSGSKIVSSAEHATHILTNTISGATAKILSAIVFEKAVVTTDWLQFIFTAKAAEVIPSPAQYFPPIEENVQLVDRNLSRRELLKGYLIIATRKTDEQYISLLIGCGGRVLKSYELDPVSLRQSVAELPAADKSIECVFWDESTPLSVESSQEMSSQPPATAAKLWLTSTQLAASIFNNSPPFLAQERPYIRSASSSFSASSYSQRPNLNNTQGTQSQFVSKKKLNLAAAVPQPQAPVQAQSVTTNQRQSPSASASIPTRVDAVTTSGAPAASSSTSTAAATRLSTPTNSNNTKAGKRRAATKLVHEASPDLDIDIDHVADNEGAAVGNLAVADGKPDNHCSNNGNSSNNGSGSEVPPQPPITIAFDEALSPPPKQQHLLVPQQQPQAHQQQQQPYPPPQQTTPAVSSVELPSHKQKQLQSDQRDLPLVQDAAPVRGEAVVTVAVGDDSGSGLNAAAVQVSAGEGLSKKRSRSSKKEEEKEAEKRVVEEKVVEEVENGANRNALDDDGGNEEGSRNKRGRKVGPPQETMLVGASSKLNGPTSGVDCGKEQGELRGRDKGNINRGKENLGRGRDNYGYGDNDNDDDVNDEADGNDGDIAIVDVDGWVAAVRGATRKRVVQEKRRLFLSEHEGDESLGHKQAQEYLLTAPDEVVMEIITNKTSQKDNLNVNLDFNFDDMTGAHNVEGSGSSSNGGNGSGHTTSSSSSSSSSGGHSSRCGRGGLGLRDVRKFKKNFVRKVDPDTKARYSEFEMVLPKESEREIQLRLESEVEESRALIRENLFADSYNPRGAVSTTGRRR